MHKGNSKFRLVNDDLFEISRDLGSLFGIGGKKDEPVITELENPFLNGTIEIYNPRHGLHLCVLNISLKRDIVIQVSMEQPMVAVSLILSGSSRQCIQPLNQRQYTVSFEPGKKVVGTYQNEKSRFELCGGQTHRLVDLHIDPSEMNHFIEFNEIEVLNPLKPIFTMAEETRLTMENSLPECARDIVYQILQCPYHGLSRQFFMESKTLEILALELDSFTRKEPLKSGWNQKDLERLEMARHILRKEYYDPPPLVQLARKVGLNDFKLKKGFRQIYNTTVFGYVRRLRMEKARILLESGGHNVTEVALATGYSSFGHFSTAFKKYFGLLPSDILWGSKANGSMNYRKNR